jgi:hypothetical protein
MRTGFRKARSARALLAVAAAALLAVFCAASLAIAHHHHGDHRSGPVGTIESFDSETGKLAIDLAEGGTVSGVVTGFTWIDDGDHHCWGEGSARHRCAERRNVDHGDDEGHDGWGNHHGDTSALVPGAGVEDAVLILKDGRAWFAKVDLED